MVDINGSEVIGIIFLYIKSLVVLFMIFSMIFLWIIAFLDQQQFYNDHWSQRDPRLQLFFLIFFLKVLDPLILVLSFCFDTLHFIYLHTILGWSWWCSNIILIMFHYKPTLRSPNFIFTFFSITANTLVSWKNSLLKL